MNTTIAMIDIIFGILVLIMVVRCILQGFLQELFIMFSCVFGILAAISFYKNGALFLREHFFKNPQSVGPVPEILAFAGVFFIVFLAIKVIEKLVNDIVSKVKLFQWLNRFLGIFLGLIEGMALVTLLLFIIDVQPLLDNDQKERILAGSVFADRIMPFIEKTKENIPNTLKDVLPEPNTISK